MNRTILATCIAVAATAGLAFGLGVGLASPASAVADDTPTVTDTLAPVDAGVPYETLPLPNTFPDAPARPTSTPVPYEGTLGPIYDTPDGKKPTPAPRPTTCAP